MHPHKIADNHNLQVIGPDEPTHIHTPIGSTDVLDIAIIKNITTTTTIETIDDLFSDHLPVRIDLDIDTHTQTDEKTGINWKTYKDNIFITHTTINNKNDINAAVTQLEKDIKSAISSATWTKKTEQSRHQEHPSRNKKKANRKKKNPEGVQKNARPQNKNDAEQNHRRNQGEPERHPQ